LDSAISEKRLKNWSEAEEVTGVSATELLRRRDLAMGITDEEEGGETFRIHEE